MMTLDDFISCPKIDAHNHLNLGMRYSTYVQWSGFYIPDFPRNLKGLSEMHEIIGDYTRPRSRTEQDVIDLISFSIEDAIKDGVTVLEGSIDIGFINQCGSIDEFLKMTESLVKKYEKKIKLRPEFGMGKTFGIDKILNWAPPCLESGLFKSIDLYGPEVEDGLSDFKPIYALAGKLGIKRKAHVGEFSDANSVRRFIEIFDLEEVQHGIGAIHDDKVVQFLADNKIRLNVTPESNVMLGAAPSMAEHPIKKLYEAGCKVSIATDDLLFFGRNVSEQAFDLVQAGALTEAQIKAIFKSNVSDYK